MIVPEESIREVLSLYKPEQRILQSANIDYPKIEGHFLIGKTYYTLSPFEHATDIEIQLCLNQLAYVGISETIKLSLDPLFKGIDFKNLQKEGMYIIESRKRFKRQINPNKEIEGSILIKEKINKMGIIFCYADFQFENKSCFGNLELAVINKVSNGETK